MDMSASDNDRRNPGDSKKVIYDFGANNGDDVPYYLKKADVVVAVEANPALCRQIEERFGSEIRAGRVQIENCVLVPQGDSAEVSFYLHKRHHVLGQFPRPDNSVIGDYDRVLLPARSVVDIVRKHGSPYYIKVDIEGSDESILRELFRNGVRPPYISAEAQSSRVFAVLAGVGEYPAFKLVEGETVDREYRQHPIRTEQGQDAYSFPRHSAGPFGEDVKGDWMNADDLFALLAEKGLGWRDIHATNLVEPESSSKAVKKRQMLRHFRGWIRTKIGPHRKPENR